MLSTEALVRTIIVVGALLLVSSTLSKRWFYAEWVKTAFWIVFVAAMFDMALAFVLTHLTFFRRRILAHPLRKEHLHRYRRWNAFAVLLERRGSSRISSLA